MPNGFDYSDINDVLMRKGDMITQVLRKNPSKSKRWNTESAKPQTVRHLNLALVLDLIRKHQPISRANLARHAGIHRSNISMIVEDLQERGLLREEMSKERNRGRTPTLIYLDHGDVRVIAANLRRERTTLALVAFNGHIESTYTFETPRKPDAFLNEMAAGVQSMTTGPVVMKRAPVRIAQMVMSIPGIADKTAEDAQAVWIPSMDEFSGIDLASILTSRLGFPCFLGNNAGLGAIAALRETEKHGEKLEDFTFLFIGDVGIGSGVILHRSLYSGHDAIYAGEVGHSVIDLNGPKCKCGRRGCWQMYVCDQATWTRYNPRVEFSISRFDEFLDEVEAGSPKALAALKKTANYLSIGISNLLLTINPERIVIAGALTRVWPILQKELKLALFLSHHNAKVQAIQLPADTLFMQGAIERAIDLAIAQY